MSSVYLNEPSTSGKVVMQTTFGDLEIELWCKEAPKATRNFIQLCLEGYYDGTIIHRVVPGFIVQGGDPSGTGDGGESVYEGHFSAEFHSRLKFNRRGLLGAVNMEKKGIGSQFFFTLAATPELNNLNTLFGKIVGDTVFNMLKMGEIEVEGERPVYPPRIIGTRVLDHPFEIKPRIKQAVAKEQKEMKIPKLNSKLLSFEVEQGLEKIKERESGESGERKKTVEKNQSEQVNNQSESRKHIESKNQGGESKKQKILEEIEKLKKQIKKSKEQKEKIQVEEKRPLSFVEQQRELYKKKENVIVGKRRRRENDESEVNTNN